MFPGPDHSAPLMPTATLGHGEIHLGGYSLKKIGEVGCLVISNLCFYGSISFLFLAHLFLL